MDTSNHWYGHAHVLARYCGLDDRDPPTIWGVLQHGWHIDHGLGAGHAPPHGFPTFLWSNIGRRRGQAIGWRDYYVIGAPWVYLLTEFPEPPPRSEREGTIFYPFHTWEGADVRIEGDHHRVVEEILATESGPVTACLYYLEYEMPEVRGAYERAGFEVICHGRRGLLRRGTEPDFLYHQHEALVRHRRVASNRMCTAILYGASVGCEAGVYGDPMRYIENRIGHGEVEDGDARVRRLHPALYGVQLDDEFLQGYTHAELGMGQRATPAELREVLGWQHA